MLSGGSAGHITLDSMAKRYIYFRAPDGTLVEVKDGFCWPAFFFGGLWPLVRREWLLAMAMLIVFAALTFLDEAFVKGHRSLARSTFMLAAYAVYMLICGLRTNKWFKAALVRRGYSIDGQGNAA